MKPAVAPYVANGSEGLFTIMVRITPRAIPRIVERTALKNNFTTEVEWFEVAIFASMALSFVHL